MAVRREARLVKVSYSLSDNKPTYTRLYHVITDRGDSISTPFYAAGVPPYGSGFSLNGFTDRSALALDFSTDTDESRDELLDDGSGDKVTRWPITVINKRKDSKENEDNPLNEPPQISGSFSSRHFMETRDRTGKALKNKAGDLLDPLPQGEELTDTVNIQFNSATISLPLRTQAKNKVNSSPMWGLGKRQIKLTKWSYQIKYHEQYPYVSNNISCEISYQSHPNTVDNQGAKIGFYNTFPHNGWGELKDGKLIRALDDQDVPYTQKTWLDVQGQQTKTESYIRYELEDEFNLKAILPDPLPGPFA